MLKGHVFSKQIFGNPIFALFINTFLSGQNGVSNNYKNGMRVTYSGSNINVESGAICIQGRFLEEDTSKQIAAGTDTSYCKLVIEINLDKENTESELNQASYKIIKSASSYPSLTQTNIVKNDSGIYQYELARFKTSANGIIDFQDMRTFLDFDSIYAKITAESQKLISQLETELEETKKQSGVLLSSNVKTYNNSFKNGHIDYETNWHVGNTIILCATVDSKGNQTLNGEYDIEVELNQSSISVNLYKNGQIITDATTKEKYWYKVVLMKI